VVALIVPILSFLGVSANLFLTWRNRQRLDAVFISPIRYDPMGSWVFYMVSAASPVQEVKFEFIKNHTGGTVTRNKVVGGEIRFQHGDFVSERGTLVQPEGKNILAATVSWRRHDKGKWETCGTYITAGSSSHLFRPLISKDEGDT
jgi:hypothetical protein